MKWVILLPLALVLLDGCAETQPGDDPSIPRGRRLCFEQCEAAQSYCRELCDLNQRACVQNVRTQAERDYSRYTIEQLANHQPVEFNDSDFERMAPCDDAKKSCTNACQKDYRSCYENCEGPAN